MSDVTDEFPLEETEEEQSVFPADAASDEMLGEGIKKLISKKSAPHMKELVEDLIDDWGGPRQIARALHQTYQSAPPGSMTRSRILDRVISFMQTVKEDDAENEFDDETLIAVIKQEMNKYGQADHPVHLSAGRSSKAISQHSDSSGDSGG